MFEPDYFIRASRFDRASGDVALPYGNGAAGSGFHGEFSALQRDIARTIAQGFVSDESDAAYMVQGGAVPAPIAVDRLLFGEDGGATTDKLAFIDSILPFARVAGEALGVSENLVAAHAALESGWGMRPLANGAGADSYNLFGIKAGASWSGPVAEVQTTEYMGGQPIKTVERFRAYSGYRASFEDYAAMLRGNRRYSGVMGAGTDAAAFATGLVKGGYATDPAYASKLRRVAADVAAARERRDANVNAKQAALADPPARRLPGR
ncbi:glycoside hydrolase family 73 protein [Burkholderia diffusa]|uniref:glycoside hydrolase family 73 protein n=1 Tax=Burkholderia diffusa TaxID=488732 RepID=UPI0009C023ED|nr:glucosaminidase domain-containing protein [Burkholderia diffusa]